MGLVAAMSLFTAVSVAAVVGGFRQPDAASGAAISAKLGKAIGTRSAPRQAQRPRADRANRLHQVLLADRPHQVS